MELKGWDWDRVRQREDMRSVGLRMYESCGSMYKMDAKMYVRWRRKGDDARVGSIGGMGPLDSAPESD